MPATKIATCSYCGARAVFTFDGVERHELCCSNCGAPLHELKQMPVHRAAKTAQSFSEPPHRKVENRKVKRRSRIRKKIFEEVWDIVEDIFD